MLNYVRQFFAILPQVTHYLIAVKIFKKSNDWKILARTYLNLLKLSN